MEAVMEVAKSLGQSMAVGQNKEEKAEAEEKSQPGEQTGTSQLSASSFPFPALENILNKGKGDRGAILRAIKPYMEEKKQLKVDQVTKMMQSLELLLRAKDLF